MSWEAHSGSTRKEVDWETPAEPLRDLARRVGLPVGAIAIIAVILFAINISANRSDDTGDSLGGGQPWATDAPRVTVVRDPAHTASGTSVAPAGAADPEHRQRTGAWADSFAAQRVDAQWSAEVAQQTGIPERALIAYAAADLVLEQEMPGCELGWNTIAGIGWMESQHGFLGKAQLHDDGVARPPIIGPALDGTTFLAVPDTDRGELDGDAKWDRAVGPMQFIPETWRDWAADGNGDGIADPHQIDDAALASARYLCSATDMSDATAWRSALLAYNPSEDYVDQVAMAANLYAAAVSSDGSDEDEDSEDE